MSHESVHWSIFNIMARLFGLMASLASAGFGTTAVLQFSGVSLSTPGVSALGNLLVSLFCFAIAVGFLTVRSFRPDISRKRLASVDTSLSKLGWWTGAPKN